MVKLVVHRSGGLDMSRINYSGMFNGAQYLDSSTLSVRYADGASQTFKGFGFGLDTHGEPTKGIVTSYSLFSGGIRAVSVEGARFTLAELAFASRTGSTADDRLFFETMLSKNDTITGGGLGDTLLGFNGNDKITGADGADKLYGGDGADTFIFRSHEDSTVSILGRDRIFDFSQEQRDRIDLRGIDANFGRIGNQSFDFIGTERFSKTAGELRYEKRLGDTYIHADIDGDGRPDFSIVLAPTLNLRESDFLL